MTQRPPRPPSCCADYVFFSFKGLVYRHYVDEHGRGTMQIEYAGATCTTTTEADGRLTRQTFVGALRPDGTRGGYPEGWPRFSGNLDDSPEPTDEQIAQWEAQDEQDEVEPPFAAQMCEVIKKKRP